MLYLLWGPIAFFIGLVMRNFKHFGCKVAVLHSISGIIVIALSIFAVYVKSRGRFDKPMGKAGLFLIILMCWLLTTGLLLQILKIVKAYIPAIVLSIFRFLHIVSELVLIQKNQLISLGCAISVIFGVKYGFESLGDAGNQSLEILWGFSYGIFVIIALIFEIARSYKWCSKRDYKETERNYTSQTFQYQILGGRKLVILDNRVIQLPLLFNFFHPGGQDIGRYVYGIYKYPKQSKEHIHSPYALNRMRSNVVGLLSDNLKFRDRFYGQQLLDISYEWLNDTWRIGSRSRITSLVKRISFQKLGLNRRLFISDPTCWGKHFKGLGLKIRPGAYGTHIALTAGTGIVPFLDIVFYLLRRNIFRAGQIDNRLLQIFKNEFQFKALNEDFRLVLWASFEEQQEVIALKYMRLLEQISNQYQFNNFNLVLRLSKSAQRWDVNYLREHLQNNAEVVWIRGPQQFNQTMKDCLSTIGYNSDQVVQI